MVACGELWDVLLHDEIKSSLTPDTPSDDTRVGIIGQYLK